MICGREDYTKRPRLFLLMAALLLICKPELQAQDTTYYYNRLQDLYASEWNDSIINQYHQVKTALETQRGKEKAGTIMYKAMEDLIAICLVDLIIIHGYVNAPYDSVMNNLWALEDLGATKDTYLADTFILLEVAIYLIDSGRIAEGIATLERAIDVYDRSGEDLLKAGAHIELIYAYMDLNEFALAHKEIEILESIDGWSRGDTGVKERGRIVTLSMKATLLHLQGKYSESLDLLSPIDIEELCDNPDAGFPMAFEVGIVRCKGYVGLGNLEEAKKVIDLLVSCLPKTANNELYENMARVQLVEIAVLNKDIDQATRHIDTLREGGVLELDEKLVVMNANYKIAMLRGNYEEAIMLYTNLIDFKDSLNLVNEKHRGALLTYRLSKENELVRLNEANKAKDELLIKNRVVYVLTAITVVVLLLSGFAMINVRKQKRQIKLQAELYKVKEVATLKNNFLENLSHEIRTPITAISGYLNLLKKNTLNPSNILKYSDMAVKNCGLMINTLNNFLTLLKLEKTSFQSRSLEGNMAEHLRVLVGSFEPGARLRGIHLYHKSNLKPEATIVFPYDFLGKIVTNLVSNALKYTHTEKSIYVSTILEEQELVITVKDEGIGIGPEELELIFDRFYQSEQHQMIGGFGIGLSLIDELVKRLGGTIRVDSEKGLGSEFCVRLPLQLANGRLFVEEVDRGFTCLTVDGEKVEPSGKVENLPKVLIVDDNTEMIVYLNELLSSDLQCHFAFNGEEALKKAQGMSFDLIISDLRMPVMNGIEFKQALNELAAYRDVPFIILSASATEITSEARLELGVSDYIQKPFGDEEIMARIRFLLENKVYRKKLYSMDNEVIDFHASHSDLIEKVKEAVLDNMANFEFGVKDLAEICGQSQSQVNSIVQAKTGLSLVKIILEIRLLKAYELITLGKYQTISEVVYAIGLNSRPYFYKRFQERFGIKAGELMKKYNRIT